MTVKKSTFLQSLNALQVAATQNHTGLSIKEIFTFLAGRGYPSLIVLLSMPFCFPLQIPGFSTPFGLLLAFLGLRIAFAKKLWWPQWILKKRISSKTVIQIAKKTIYLLEKLQKILKPRLQFLSLPPFYNIHGILIFLLGIFLALPLPIPFTNLLTAIPILCIGLGLLEDDGVAILLGYMITILSIVFVLLAVWGFFRFNH